LLFDPEAHEPCTGAGWNPGRIRDAIGGILAEAEAARADSGWPLHPADREPGDGERPLATVYLGAAGTVQALAELDRRGLAGLDSDLLPLLRRPYADDFPEQPAHEGSLWMGETGIRLVEHRLSPSATVADRLAQLVSGNARDERCEVMWGSPGTMLAARAMHERTGEPRWLDLWRESAEWLRERWDGETGVWTQRLYGRVWQFLGPAHGFAGIAMALAAEPDAALHRRICDIARRHAVVEDGLANWPPLATGGLRAADGSIRVQWCHGAPGMVTSLARLLPGDDAHTELLAAGGELTWRAGPLAKGPGLCHGTAGNGYALLALFERTGDELWLERARAFAMHAAGQVERERERHGRGRHSLWTGDPGVALYLADCIDGSFGLPLP
jgi:hypothetical protein